MNSARLPAVAIALAAAVLLALAPVSVRAGDPPAEGAAGTGAAPAAANETKPAAAKTMTMKGEIVDLSCYLTHGAKGAKHQACALTCLKNGEPMGLLTESGDVYLLLAPHEDAKAFNQAKEYAAAQVEVTGPTAESSGIKVLTVNSVKKI